MNNKGLKHIIIFLCVWILVPLFFKLIDFPAVTITFLFIPAIYIIPHCFRSIEYSKFSVKSFLTALLFLSIPLKIDFRIYNFVIHLTLIILGIYILKKEKNLFKNDKALVLFFLVFLNSILFLTPNKWILDGFNHEKISYTENLNWSDFKGEPDMKYFADAIIVSGYQYKINSVFNYPRIVIGSYMNSEKSWKKELQSTKGSKLLLKHEQGHFDIREAFCRKIKDSINKRFFSNHSEIEKIINHFTKIQIETGNKYDDETYHGSIIEEQEIWNYKIHEMLKN